MTVESAQVPLDGLLLVTARAVRGDSDPEPGTTIGEVAESYHILRHPEQIFAGTRKPDG